MVVVLVVVNHLQVHILDHRHHQFPHQIQLTNDPVITMVLMVYQRKNRGYHITKNQSKFQMPINVDQSTPETLVIQIHEVGNYQRRRRQQRTEYILIRNAIIVMRKSRKTLVINVIVIV